MPPRSDIRQVPFVPESTFLYPYNRQLRENDVLCPTAVSSQVAVTFPAPNEKFPGPTRTC